MKTLFSLFFLFASLFSEPLWVKKDFHFHPEYEDRFVNQLMEVLSDDTLWQPLSHRAIDSFKDSIRSDRLTGAETKSKVMERFEQPHSLKIVLSPIKYEESRVIYWPVAGDRTIHLKLQTRWYSPTDSLLASKSYAYEESRTKWFCGLITCKIPLWSPEMKRESILRMYNEFLNEFEEDSREILQNKE